MTTQSITDVGLVPYWATTGPDGKYCYVSLSGDNSVSVIDYETGDEVSEIPVGNFPQRSRLGTITPRVRMMLND